MKLNFKEFGEGDPVIILHGLFGSLDNWQTFAKKISSDFKVYTLDLRNHGKSPHSDELSYEAMAADILEFFDDHNIETAHVIGHSMGGKVAMKFALENPQRLQKLIVVDIAPREYAGDNEPLIHALMDLDLSAVQKREDAENQLKEKIPSIAVRQFLLKNLDRKTDNSFGWKMNLQALHKNYDQINVAIEKESKVKLPALLIRGKRSDYVTDDDFRQFQLMFPNSSLATIENAGHWVHAEAPDEFLNKVREFLKD